MAVVPWTATDATNADRLFLVLSTSDPIAKLISAPGHSNATGSIILVQHAFEDSLENTISTGIFA